MADMQQRNDTGYPLNVNASPPFTVVPGQTLTYPSYITGCTVLDTEGAAEIAAIGVLNAG